MRQITWEISYKDFFCFVLFCFSENCQEPYLEPKQMPKVELFGKILNGFYLLTFFAKKPYHKCLTVFQKRLWCLYMLPFCFLHWLKSCSGSFIQAFFIWETNKWSLVELDSNDCIGICLGGLSIGLLRRLVVL